MPIRFFCTKCRFRIRVPEDAAGMTFGCMRCGFKQPVPRVTDPEAEKASQNRRNFLAAVGTGQDAPTSKPQDQEEPPIQLIVDDQEDVFVAEIADEDEAADEMENSALTQLGQAVGTAETLPLPTPQPIRQARPQPASDPLAALGQAVAPRTAEPLPDLAATHPPISEHDSSRELASLAQQVAADPGTARPAGSKPAAKPATKPLPKTVPKKPVPAKPARVLRPAPASQPALAARRAAGSVPALIIWAVRVLGVLGIPAGVKLGLLARDLTSDPLIGLAVGVTIGMIAALCFISAEIAQDR